MPDLRGCVEKFFGGDYHPWTVFKALNESLPATRGPALQDFLQVKFPYLGEQIGAAADALRDAFHQGADSFCELLEALQQQNMAMQLCFADGVNRG